MTGLNEFYRKMLWLYFFFLFNTASERLLCVCLLSCVWGVGFHAGAAEEQYNPSSHYPVNVIIARHERCMSTEAQAHAPLFNPQAFFFNSSTGFGHLDLKQKATLQCFLVVNE